MNYSWHFPASVLFSSNFLFNDRCPFGSRIMTWSLLENRLLVNRHLKLGRRSLFVRDVVESVSPHKRIWIKATMSWLFNHRVEYHFSVDTEIRLRVGYITWLFLNFIGKTLKLLNWLVFLNWLKLFNRLKVLNWLCDNRLDEKGLRSETLLKWCLDYWVSKQFLLWWRYFSFNNWAIEFLWWWYFRYAFNLSHYSIFLCNLLLNLTD